MKKLLIIAIVGFLFFYQNSLARTLVYEGFIGKSSITMVIYTYSTSVERAFYAYNNYDTPIALDAKWHKDKLTLIENDIEGSEFAIQTFENFNPDESNIEGAFEYTKKKSTSLTIKLKKTADFESYSNNSFSGLELLQFANNKDEYFKIVLDKKANELAIVVGINIYKKRNDKLLDTFMFRAQFASFGNLIIEDYNFDGTNDFSVFESFYAGPNTSSIYFLFDGKSKRYFKSEIKGISLEFDSDSKTIREHNQCCAGTWHSNSLYKIVDNKMVLISQNCIKWDDDKEDHINVDCE